MSNIAVVVDSGSGISKDEANQQGIFYLPLQIVEDDKTYLDGIDITIEEVFNKIENEINLKTSLPSIGYMHELIRNIKDKGYDHIIVVTLSSGLSSTLDSFRLACSNLEMPVTCIETWTTCYLQGYVAEKAKEFVDQGLDVEEIENKLNHMIEESDTFIVPNDLDHLKKGGRLTPLAASMANLLKIRPILQMNKQTNGKIDTKDKVRTLKKALLSMVEQISDKIEKSDEYQIIICATKGCDDTVAIVTERMKEINPNLDIKFKYIAPVIAVHTGMDCVGVQYIRRG